MTVTDDSLTTASNEVLEHEVTALASERFDLSACVDAVLSMNGTWADATSRHGQPAGSNAPSMR